MDAIGTRIPLKSVEFSSLDIFATLKTKISDIQVHICQPQSVRFIPEIFIRCVATLRVSEVESFIRAHFGIGVHVDTALEKPRSKNGGGTTIEALEIAAGDNHLAAFDNIN